MNFVVVEWRWFKLKISAAGFYKDDFVGIWILLYSI